MESLTDNALMSQVRDGDLDKLSLLFERYKRPLLGFFYGLTRNSELGEDLVQNTFLRVLKYRHLFRGDGDFRTWLFHIARNVSHDQFNRKKNKPQESIGTWENRLVHEDHQSSRWIQEEKHQLLDMAMARLDEEKREILLLSKYQEKKYRDIGEIIGCSEAAVKVKVFRALAELRTIYLQLEKSM